MTLEIPRLKHNPYFYRMQQSPGDMRKHSKRSFHAFSVEGPSCDFLWHSHPELEITYIEKGSGKRFVGDHTGPFRDGDLVLLGPNLPHTWMDAGTGGFRAHVLQFSPAILKPYADVPEFRKIISLCDRAGSGLSFRGNGSATAGAMLTDLQRTKGTQQVMAFLKLFHTLSQLDASPISGSKQLRRPSLQDSREYRTLYYIHRNWDKDPQVAEISVQLGLTQSAFCHFFKRMTGKSFSECITDIRVRRICADLLNGEDPIPMIAACTGFRNISYFNRQFRKRTGMTPMVFRKRGK